MQLAQRQKKQNAAKGGAPSAPDTPVPGSPASVADDETSGKIGKDEVEEKSEGSKDEGVNVKAGDADAEAEKKPSVEAPTVSEHHRDACVLEKPSTSDSAPADGQYEAEKGSDKAVIETKGNTARRPSDDEQAENIASPSRSPSNSLGNLQQTVTLLMSEQIELQSQVSSLQQSLDAAKGDAQLLVEGRSLIAQLEAENEELVARIGQLTRERDSMLPVQAELETERKKSAEARRQRDTLQSKLELAARGSEDELRQSRDRETELEKSLERAQAREGGLEAELGRLRQVSRGQSDADNRPTLHCKGMCPERRLNLTICAPGSQRRRPS